MADVNECELENICGIGERCKNVIGSFECISISRQHQVTTPTNNKENLNKQCEPGFRWVRDKCVGKIFFNPLKELIAKRKKFEIL